MVPVTPFEPGVITPPNGRMQVVWVKQTVLNSCSADNFGMVKSRVINGAE
jgi:hypothetical protein